MRLLENHELAGCTTFAVRAAARWLTPVADVDQLEQAIRFARERELPWLLLGGGSNLLLTRDYPGLVIRLDSRGVECLEELPEEGAVIVRAHAGENWHELVWTCLVNGWHGLENLALIPGRVGAAPVQNIGAYGVELSDRLLSVEMLDSETLETRRLEAGDCEFGYRDSIFKNALRGRAVILSIDLKLSTVPRVNIRYESLKQYLAEQGFADPEPVDVFEAVCNIRRQRLPDPAEIGNAGSFFKNPVVDGLTYRRLLYDHPGMPGHELDPHGSDTRVKLPAAWLIEHTGWKGERRGPVGVHDRQALVLVNHGGATGAEVLALAREVAASVYEHFEVRLQPEVRILPDGWPDSVDAGITVEE